MQSKEVITREGSFPEAGWLNQNGARAAELGLSREEMATCQICGVNPDDYFKTKGDLKAAETLRNGLTPDLSYLKIVNPAKPEASKADSISLSPEEQKLCKDIGITPEAYALEKSRLRL